jgi:hypothetical protein
MGCLQQEAEHLVQLRYYIQLRRPGEVLTIEPGITYMFSKLNLFLTVPTAIMRNRTQSYPDQIRSSITGTNYKGDAAFADYSINLGFSLRL